MICGSQVGWRNPLGLLVGEAVFNAEEMYLEIVDHLAKEVEGKSA
jgi:hypothetical protein